MPRLAKTDVMFAHMALHLVAGLSPSARRVGAAIIEHYNKKTGQCDPSIERLARMLGIDRATVMRVTGELCEADGLFERVTHEGHSHRTAYLPRWDRLNTIVDDWDLRMKDGSPPRKVAKMRHKPTEGTGRRNLRCRLRGRRMVRADYPNRPASQDRRNGLRKKIEPQPQRFLVHAITGGKAPSRQDAAEAAAERRRAAEISKLPKHEREAAWLAAMGDRP